MTPTKGEIRQPEWDYAERVLQRLRESNAENERLRQALHSIAHTAICDAQNLRDIAADALRTTGEADHDA